MTFKFSEEEIGMVAYMRVPGKTAEDYFRDKDQPPSLARILRGRILGKDGAAKSLHATFNGWLADPKIRAYFLGDDHARQTQLVWRLIPRKSPNKRQRSVRSKRHDSPSRKKPIVARSRRSA